jgi:seryl-tRNA synthetase
VLGSGCDNARTIARPALETRVLAGLREKLMTPEAAAEAMRSYVAETNRLNRERRDSAYAIRRELAEIKKTTKEIVGIIEKGGWYTALSERLGELEKREEELNARLTDVPEDIPDIHPGIVQTYRKRVERLTEALNHPDAALEATAALRELIDRIVITPGEPRKDYRVTLHGDLETILNWIERSGRKGYKPAEKVTAELSATANSRACPGHPRLSLSPKRGCPAQGRA